MPLTAALCHVSCMRMLYCRLVGILVGLAAVGCAASEAEVKREFNEFVSDHQACEQDSDCVLIQPGCPLGCSVPIASDAAADAERLARELINDYERGGRGCDYGCSAVCGAACSAGSCVVVKPTSSTELICPSGG